MKIEINCQKRWFEAQQKAAELGDKTLNACIARCISFATCNNWEVEQAEKEYEKARDKWSRAWYISKYALENDKPYYRRACELRWRLDRKMHEAFIRKCDMEQGGRDILHISSDFCEYSFYFWIEREDGFRRLNGGIIFQGGKWQIHT